MKKILYLLIVFSVIFSTTLNLDVKVLSASTDYLQTSKDNVPLRNNYGEEYEILSKIKNKGAVVLLLETKKKKVGLLKWNTWHKVQILESKITTDNSITSYWIYEGNLTKHKHNMKDSVCQSEGCKYYEPVIKKDDEIRHFQVKYSSVAVRELPYLGGDELYRLSKGTPVTTIGAVKNSKNHIWYKLYDNSGYIYSDNVKELSSEKIEKVSNDKQNTGNAGGNSGSAGGNTGNTGDNSGSTDGNTGSINGNNSENLLDTNYFVPTTTVQPCTHKSWSVGKCVNCGKEWELDIKPVTGTYKANKDTPVRVKPYREGAKTDKVYKKGDIVPVLGRAKNSAGNYWYKTSDGWVYDVGEVSLKDIQLSVTGYTFDDMNDSITPIVTTTPSNAAIKSIVWNSSKPQYAEVDFMTGKITPKSPGNTVITCTVTSSEGTVKKDTINIRVTEEAALEKWEYYHLRFEYDLALKCSVYSALAYPQYNYNYDNNRLLVFPTDSSPDTPENLVKLLEKEEFSYKISNNYYAKTRGNSPYVLAHKYVKYLDKKTPIVYVIIEGTAGILGWEGNMMITGDNYSSEMDEHKTFETSAEDIKKGLEEYKNNNKLQNPIVVITGHSRGAAAGNLLAEKLNNSTGYSRIYAYLFATPNVTKNPVESKNIYNICNESDFVPYIPLSLSGWGYEKHGITYSFDSAFLSTGEYGPHFNNYAEKAFEKSKYSYRKPDYNWASDTVEGLRDYMAGKWKTVDEYYSHNPDTYSESTVSNKNCNIEAYNYFFNGLAQAASGGDRSLILAHAADVPWSGCPFKKISWFFIGNGATVHICNAFRDSHEMVTYHAAMLSKLYNSGSKAYIFSDDIYGNGAVNINQDEYDALYSFFTQKDNELMLEIAEWNIDDPSTWKGIKWDDEGNVISIDLSYLNLSGWFNANNYPKLQTLNLDGNNISMLAVSECSELVNLSCMANSISSLAVDGCGSLQTLDCAFNTISELDVSGMSQLSDLNCYGNNISSLDLNGAISLQTLRCGNNELYTVDISTNTSLNTFYCDNNNIVESQNADLLNSINTINANGGSAIIGTQKYNPNYEFNASELSCLTEFANMSLNLEKLGWDLDNPHTWQGVEWKIVGNEYHVTDINFDGIDLEGDFNLPEAEYIESVSLQNLSLSTMNLSGCTNLSTVNCYNSGISDLVIDDCTSLERIDCEENNLEVEKVESTLNQIGLNGSMSTYVNQNIDADEAEFNECEREELVSFLHSGVNYEVLGWDWDLPGTWKGINWRIVDDEYRVSSIDFSAKAVCGELDLSGFDYLSEFNFSGTQIESVILPKGIIKIPEYAFYNSDIKYVHMSEGVANIEKFAFAHCDNLNTIVIPKSVTKILDNAFYESSNLKNLVFIGDEPLVVGKEIALGTSSEFNLIYFADSDWNGTTDLLNDYSYIVNKDDFIVLLDEDIKLKDDTYYNETNNYAGDDINVTVITSTPGISGYCMLTVFDESDNLDTIAPLAVEMTDYMTVVCFEDIDIQYVGEEYCMLKVFLWNNLSEMKPMSEVSEKILIKPVAE